MYRMFERIVLGEAANQPPPKSNQQEPDPHSLVQQPPPPPDFTEGNGGGTASQPDTTDPNNAPAPPEPQMPAGPPPAGGLDPTMGGADPSQQDPNADPNAAGMEGEGDPNAQQDPNQQGDPNDPNAAMGADPSAAADVPQGPNADIEQAEKEVFADLKPEQMMIKNAELKERYQEVYTAVSDSLEKINKISRTTYDDTMLDFIVKKLTNLRSMIVDSVDSAFSTRTYVENKIELQRFILAFNYLTNMMTQIYQSRLKRQQKITELNSKDSPKRDPEEFPVFTRGYDVQ